VSDGSVQSQGDRDGNCDREFGGGMGNEGSVLWVVE
jgi:hypothetical protein